MTEPDIGSRMEMLHVKLISWNVRGLNGPIKRAKIFQNIQFHKAGVVFLQETHLKLSDHTS